LAILLVPVIGLAWLWFGISPRVPDKPVRLVRGEDGQLVPVHEADTPGGIWFEAQAGKLNAQNNFSSTTSATRSGHARFPCRRIAVFNWADHLLLQRSGERLLDQLKGLGYVDQIDYYPMGHRPEAGVSAPDVVIGLDLDRIEESGLPTSRKLDASILVTAGQRLAKCRSGYSDGLSPPVVDFEFNGRLHHVSTTTGVSSSAAKYKLAADDIAKQMANALVKLFDDYREKDGPLPDLPEAFYPAYREPQEMPLAEAYELEPLVAYHGLMNRNDSFWRLTADREAGEILADVEKRMKASGWETRSISTKENHLPHLRMDKGSARLTIFPAEPNRIMTPGSIVVDDPHDQASPDTGTTVYVHYLDRMTRKEVEKAIEKTLGEQMPLESLLLFEDKWTTDQCQRVLALLESRPSKTPQGWITMAELYHRGKQDEQSRAALRRARLLTRTVANPGDLQDQIKKLAKDLGEEEMPEEPPDPALLKELGFIELRADVEVPDVELGIDEPVHFFGITDEGCLKTISLRVVEGDSREKPPSYSLAHVESMEHGRSWGKGGMNHGALINGVCDFSFNAVQLGDKERFRLSIEASRLRQESP
jgi:hypothetical protein